jgi:phosphinothricin acetyltransferase
MTIRPVTPADAAGIAAIYNHYVTETIVTFEETVVSTEEMARRIEEVRSASLPWLVALEAQQIAGYAYATKWRARSGYRFSAEVTVYLDPVMAGKGIGSRLYRELFPILEANGLHAIVGAIALPNPASIALHERFGMRKVAHFAEVGRKLGRWVDVGYWQRTFAPPPSSATAPKDRSRYPQ